MIGPVSEYFRCLELHADVELAAPLPPSSGYFRLGHDLICYGRSTSGSPAQSPTCLLSDVASDVSLRASGLRLPFDPKEIIDNLRCERYALGTRQADTNIRGRLLQSAYYLLRPFLPLSIRRHLQSIHLRNWRNISFPHWPVDRTIDALMQKLLALTATAEGLDQVPFVWFWPDGADACAIMTHDVEAEPGRDFCSTLMDIDDQFDIPASFQIVPEVRYEVTPEFLNEIRTRGFEINVQDLNHDGRLFRNYAEFKRRVAMINRYGQEYGAKGFRSAILYRNEDWFDHLDFSYDLSVPNVAHLDPQRGGCCTVMPYFIGDMLELPVTASQDHTLFNVLNDYSLTLWQQQVEKIMDYNGLIGFIVHPDYILTTRARDAYKRLLEYLSSLRADRNVWIALPGEVDRWWRQRAQMNVVYREGKWTVEGEGHERARVAFACVKGDRIEYEFADAPVHADSAFD